MTDNQQDATILGLPKEVEKTAILEGLDILDGKTPWRVREMMPEKPDGFEWGVKYDNGAKHGNRDQACDTVEELTTLVADEKSKISYIYASNEDRGGPIACLSSYEAVTKKDYFNHCIRTLRLQGLLGVAAIIGALKFDLGDTFLILGLFFGVLPAIGVLLQWLLFPGNQSQLDLKRGVVHSFAFQQWINAKHRSRMISWLIVGIIVSVFIGQKLYGLIPSTQVGPGEIHAAKIRNEGEWWRLFTGTLMHSQTMLFHVLFNAIGFVYFGKYIHRLTHPVMVLISFVFCALLGAFASLFFGGWSLGASGGVVGMMGFLSYLCLVRKSALPHEFKSMMIANVMLVSVIGIASVTANLNIDNAGHAGGFGAGLLLGVIYQLVYSEKWDLPTSPVFIVGGVLSGFVLVFGFATCIDLFYFNGAWLVPHLPTFSW